MLHEDERYMRRALQIAALGAGRTAPNPMVGAVVVCDGRIIGEGYHVRCGGPHAEVNALAAVSEADRALLPKATLYVSLEPCCHYGKTPPCSELIIRHGVHRVVVGCEDPFPKVSGGGIEQLRAAGIEVTVGVLEEACKHLNRKFITYHTLRRPYVTLKWAVSSDGYLDRWRERFEDAPAAKLSSERSQQFVHRLRSEAQAIVVGHRTLQLDRPRLNVRAWCGANPSPVVLGCVGEDELPAGWQAYDDTQTLLQELWRQGMQSVLVEGGRQTLQTFIDEGLWDEAYEERSAVELGSGVPAPKMPVGVRVSVEQHFGSAFTHWEK
ncbi:MAG: bifunctional diaminohydroxyphosphoribosylaminopyrimidine deaminase/5-amino-6-(5-phosphoribosylamino)uracil reductase RibD [Alloprevotella sp.]|nr:bifunctional diaminohydroxyphosphoribosylaminopyrimidine deaminase/5-amino-6-(5-phosphoribosylamino)uracil reductase RibD [Alloprevotella sp.]